MHRADETRLLYEVASGAVVAVDDDGLIGFATPSALELLGWDESLIGRPLTTVIPDRLLPRHLAGFARYVRTGVSNLQGSTVRVPARRRDGTEKDIDLTIRVFRRPDGSKLVSAALSEPALGHAPPHLVILERALVKRMYELL